MKVTFYIGEDYQKIDLYDDEDIFIIQKIADIEKLSNVFSDSTLSFTIPGSTTNNKIMKHYYNIDINNGYNANVRIPAYIELDSLAYKFGVIQIESVELEKNYVNNYKVTFYSKNTQLTDLFGDNTIDKLDYSDFNYEYNSTNFYKTINDPTFLSGSVITPLIAYTNRDWNYGSGDITDISDSLYPVTPTEVKSALKVIHIIEAIEAEYNISFSREFFGTPMFNKLYMWLNSKASKPSGQVLLDIINTISTSGGANPYFNAFVNTVDDIFTVEDLAYSYSLTNNFTLWVNINTLRDPLTNVQYTDNYFTLNVVDADTDVVLYTQTQKTNGVAQLNFLIDVPQASTTTTTNYKFYLSSAVKFTYSSLNINFDERFSAPPTIKRSSTLNNNGDYLNIYDIGYALPSMKIIDFITGLMKMFKMIIRPTSQTSFYVDTLDNYYNNGNILNITRYVDQDSVSISRPDIYSSIKFLYQKTENVLGKNFRLTNDPINDEIGYGDLKGEYNIDTKNELKIQLPFENMLFERLIKDDSEGNITTDICIGQSLKLDDDNITLSINDSKPILFFNNGLINITDTPIKFQYSSVSSVVNVDEYYLVGNTDNDVLNDVTNSLNWGVQIDPWHLVDVEESLYQNYWKGWMDTIYDLKQRKFKFIGYLPPRFIQEISLNDILIIGNMRYRINDYKINLVSGKTEFNLFVDIY